MKKYQGFVWFAKFQGNRCNLYVLYGPRRENPRSALNVQSTGYRASALRRPPVFYFYRTPEECTQAIQNFRKYSDFLSAYPAYISLDVAENKDEAERFSKSYSLVVIARNSDLKSNQLVGKVTPGSGGWGYIPGQMMMFNDMTPHRDLFGARFCAQESSRQGGCYPFIATWSLVLARKIERGKD